MRLKDPLSALYQLGINKRNHYYDTGVLKSITVPGVQVISIGNIAAGGSGKSPMAQHVCQFLAGQHIRTTLLLRGYGGQMEQKGGLVSNGAGPLVTWQQAGDEAFCAAQRLSHVTVRVGGDRITQAKLAAAEGTRVIVLDDGFQHRRLARQLDVVLISPKDVESETQLLPFGPLRESSSSLKRAHLLCGMTDQWLQHPHPPPVLFTYKPLCLVDQRGVQHPIHRLIGKPVHLLSGIANPARFVQLVTDLEIPIRTHKSFPDHFPFSSRHIQRILTSTSPDLENVILTTEKDLVRIPYESPSIFALQIECRITHGQEVLTSHIKSIIKATRSEHG